MEFHGAKVAVFIGPQLLVALRDDFAHIPYPACWDFAGGGREAGEDPEECALREVSEEFGLVLRRDQLVGKAAYRTQTPPGCAFFFAAHLEPSAQVDIRFGDEGQRWALIKPEAYLAYTDAIGHLQRQLTVYLEQL